MSGGSVCYDVTSISSYSQQMVSVERGYNRDGDELAQFNLGMFCDETSKMPLYYNRYNGSITDKTNLMYVLDNAKTVGISHVKMVLDGGFWSEADLKSLQGFSTAFTVGMPAHLKESESILNTHTAELEQYANEFSEKGLYGISVPTTIYDIKGRVLVYYSAWNHLHQCNELSGLLGRLQEELASLKRYPQSKLKRYTSYFTLTKHEKDSGFDYQVDLEKVEKARKRKGYFLLFSTDMTSSPEQILGYYRAKDADEKIFAQIKVDMQCDRSRTHNEKTTDGKTFVTFLACVIRSCMMQKLSKYLTVHSTSLNKVLNQLSNVMVISHNDCIRFTKALTKTQKSILDAFGAALDIEKSLNS